MKHRIHLFFLLTTLSGIFSETIHAQSRFEVDGIWYQTTSNTTVAVTYKDNGDGDPDQSYYKGNVVIPETVTWGKQYTVTSIGLCAFEGSTGLTSVTLPSSIVTIGSSAFLTCVNLTSVNLPEGLTKIEDSAFNTCWKLTSVSFPTSLTSIGETAFYDCKALTSLTIPNNIEFGELPFYGCNGLESLTIDNDNYYGDFANLTSLREVCIGDNVTNIFPYRFSGCTALTTLTIGKKVADIMDGAFSGCNSLVTVKILCDTPPTIYDATAFTNSANATLYVPQEALSAYTAANYWKDFKNIKSTEDIPIKFADENVKNICVENWDTNGDGELSYTEAAAVTDLGEVFKYNSDITSFDELQFFTGLTSISKQAFIWCNKLNSIIIPCEIRTIKYGAFWGCSALSQIVIPNSVTTMENCAFIAAGLQEINIPESIQEIGENVFLLCKSLTSVTIPNSVTSIGYGAFSGCSGLKTIVIPKGIKSIANGAFKDCSSLTSITIPESTETIGDNVFSGCSELTNAHFKGADTSLGQSVFEGCSKLGYVILPEHLKAIEPSTFNKCTNLKTIDLPSTLTSIGAAAFLLSGIVSVTIPETVTSIGLNTFNYANNLTAVTVLNSSPVTIGPYTFSNRSNATLYVPKGTVDAYKASNYWKEFKKIVEIVEITVIQDGDTYDSDNEDFIEALNYKRTFNNTEWQALYVPFAMSYEDWADDFEVARLNNVNQYDDDDDGEPDRTVLELFKLKKGGTAANTPYLIRTLSPGAKIISLTDVTLHKAEERSFDVSSWTTLFTFTGTYTGISGADMIANGYYAMGGGTLLQAASDESNLGSFRWYMSVTDRDGNPKSLGEVKVMVFDGDADGVEEVREEDKITDDAVYDLTGRRIINGNGQPAYPRKGIYIRNGRKYLVR